MKVYHQTARLRHYRKPICLATGFFDGLHQGHQRVLQSAMAHARSIGGEVWTLTFDPHPLKVLNPTLAPPMLTTAQHKLQLLRQFGVDGCLLIPFTRQFAKLPAKDFLKQLEHDIPSLAAIFMGHDWRFGHKGTGNFAMLQQWAASHPHLALFQSAPACLGHQPISSTRIRNAVMAGQLQQATRLLGRPYSILGTVRQGEHVGRKLGYPTANIHPGNEAHPPTGIYAVQVIYKGKCTSGVVNFGYRPTLNPVTTPLLEVHLFNASETLYRHPIEVFFLKRLRPERKFPTIKALQLQIRKDELKAREVLSSPPLNKLWKRTLQKWYPSVIVTGLTNSKRNKRKG